MTKTILFCSLSIAGCLATLAVGAGAVSAPPIATPYRPHLIKLQSFIAATAGPVGLMLQARVDGGPPLRLLLDTGAEYLVLDRKAAARSGHTRGRRTTIVGLDGPPKTAFLTNAATIEMDGLVLHQSPFLIVDGKVLNGIDGVIPLSMFANFLVHLDLRNRVLELEPFSARSTEAGEAFVKAKFQRKLLFLEARLQDTVDGYLLLDTGSSSNIISAAAAEKLQCYRPRTAPLILISGAGGAAGSVCREGVSVRMGARSIKLETLVAVDLSEMSRRHQLEIAGIIGYPALSEYTVTVDYRDAVVRIAKSPARRERWLAAGLAKEELQAAAFPFDSVKD